MSGLSTRAARTPSLARGKPWDWQRRLVVAALLAGVGFTLLLVASVRDEVFFSGDAGIKALLTRQYSQGVFGIHRIVIGVRVLIGIATDNYYSLLNQALSDRSELGPFGLAIVFPLHDGIVESVDSQGGIQIEKSPMT